MSLIKTTPLQQLKKKNRFFDNYPYKLLFLPLQIYSTLKKVFK